MITGMSEHWLKNYFKEWSMEALIDRKDEMIRFGGTEREMKDVNDEILRRKGELNERNSTAI